MSFRTFWILGIASTFWAAFSSRRALSLAKPENCLSARSDRDRNAPTEHKPSPNSSKRSPFVVSAARGWSSGRQSGKRNTRKDLNSLRKYLSEISLKRTKFCFLLNQSRSFSSKFGRDDKTIFFDDQNSKSIWKCVFWWINREKFWRAISKDTHRESRGNSAALVVFYFVGIKRRN